MRNKIEKGVDLNLRQFIKSLGYIAGGMTSTPGLAAADSMSDSSAPSIAYATVYPIAMVFLILFIQFIAALIV